MHDFHKTFKEVTLSFDEFENILDIQSKDKVIKIYSSGMKQKLKLALAFYSKTPILFLDEPTSGLDPRGRIEMWEVIQGLVKDGTTLLLTTQYLEEADQLADEIAVIDQGKVIARGTSDQLKKEVGGERLEIVAEAKDLKQVAEIVGKVSGGTVVVEEGSRQVSAPVTTGSRALIQAVRSLDDLGIHPLDIALKRPSLDDVFIALTGHVAEEKKSEELEAAEKRGRRK